MNCLWVFYMQCKLAAITFRSSHLIRKCNIFFCCWNTQQEKIRKRKRQRKWGYTHGDWRHEKLFIVGPQMWLLQHRRAAILLCWSGSMLHFLTCQHGQAKHRAFWHWHFASLILTDNSNRKEAWHDVVPSILLCNLCAVFTVWEADQCCLWWFCFLQVWKGNCHISHLCSLKFRFNFNEIMKFIF